jgi:peptidoglycan/LPS O-acetylase OafA/YrhL
MLMDRLEPLTGLRGFAAYSVLIAHAMDISFNYAGLLPFHPFALRLAYFGMSLFFVLSGFVIQYNYAGSFAREGLAVASYDFLVARFARLYPLYAISIIVSLPHIPAPNFSGNIAVSLAYLTLTQSWFNLEIAAFPPDWSISTEWFFYLAFIPLTILLARIIRPISALAIFSLAAMLGLSIVFYFCQRPLTAFIQRRFWLNNEVSAASRAAAANARAGGDRQRCGAIVVRRHRFCRSPHPNPAPGEHSIEFYLWSGDRRANLLRLPLRDFPQSCPFLVAWPHFVPALHQNRCGRRSAHPST